MSLSDPLYRKTRLQLGRTVGTHSLRAQEMDRRRRHREGSVLENCPVWGLNWEWGWGGYLQPVRPWAWLHTQLKQSGAGRCGGGETRGLGGTEKTGSAEGRGCAPLERALGQPEAQQGDPKNGKAVERLCLCASLPG